MSTIKPFLLVVSFIFLFGCNEKADRENNRCDDIGAALDKSSFYLRRYQQMTYIDLLHETDSTRIEKLRVLSLRELFKLRSNAVRELKKQNDIKQSSELYQRFLDNSLQLVPEEKKGRLREYSKEIFNQSARCHKNPYIRLAIYLTIEEAISLNLEDVNT